jgi:hypothetical protein
MKILRSALTIFVTICLAAPGLVLACTMDTAGTGVYITCSAGYMESHTISADGKASFKFHGQCNYGEGESSWIKHYHVSAEWDGARAIETITIDGENKQGSVISTCPSNPWLNKVTCQAQSISGSAFSDYQISGASTYPLTANSLTDAQRSQLSMEYVAKLYATSCANPVVLSPSPANGNTYTSPANVKIQIKHNPEFPPTNWQLTWYPMSWPASGHSQQYPPLLNGLNTANGVTTWTFSTSTAGYWRIFSTFKFPAYCNKGSATQQIGFKVTNPAIKELIKNQSKKPLKSIPAP